MKKKKNNKKKIKMKAGTFSLDSVTSNSQVLYLNYATDEKLEECHWTSCSSCKTANERVESLEKEKDRLLVLLENKKNDVSDALNQQIKT